MKSISLIIIFAFLFSCKNQAPSTDSAKETETKETSTDSVDNNNVAVTTDTSGNGKTDTVGLKKSNSDKSRMVIMFYSIGSGTEYELIKSFKENIQTYADSIGKKIDYKMRSWGREGETDFCFELAELIDSQQKDFILWSKGFLKNGKWVNIYENYACPARPIR